MATFLRFQVGDSPARHGLLEGDKVVALAGSIYGAWHRTQEEFQFSAVKLLAPCEPSKIICVGTNYQAVLAAKGQSAPMEPVIFLKPPSTVVGPEEAIRYPRGVQKLGYEVELAVVIKDQVKNASPEKALQHVLGYTIANDITAKDFMTGGPWTKGKCFDTFLPLGPYIVTDIDPNNAGIKSVLNGQVTQDSNTADMVFKVADIIAYVSSIMTLCPGDVISTGTPPGAGLLKPGDVVELSITGLGTLRNPVREG
ncbi:fumarylacetoacetate hydrolase family protein [Gelria sp. Kuro-4]|uniref:fumarylacetoacetate hydrolase family protein n=1 Tax=Gelria sp. Kuro-4 TaxID=2796927 RepID=UPI001BEF7580|nr:fumarylacetoacetate hydrolase family protein [Gelria sp. Kuro-4]BCV24604.1 hypothetical protein kuro4_13770 [Gelria sp. Kuro-4]